MVAVKRGVAEIAQYNILGCLFCLVAVKHIGPGLASQEFSFVCGPPPRPWPSREIIEFHGATEKTNIAIVHVRRQFWGMLIEAPNGNLTVSIDSTAV